MLRPYVVESPPVVQDDVGVCRHRLPEDSTLPVSRAPGLRARGRLQVVNEPLHDATFDESQRPGGHALIIQGARRDPTATQRIVGEGEPRVEHLLPDLRLQRGNALEHRLSRKGLRHRKHQRRQAGRSEDDGESSFGRRASALTPTPVPRYSPAAPAELATRVAVTSRSMATLTRHPSRSSRARSERPMPIKSTRDAFAARSKKVVTVGRVAGGDGGAGNSRSSASPSSADAKARSSRGAACCAPTSPPTAVVPATPTRPR